MPGLNRTDDTVTWQAAEWLLELQAPNLNVDRIAAWQKWLAENVQHRQEFDRLQMLHEQIGQISKIPWPTHEEIASDSYEGSIGISQWRSNRAQRAHQWVADKDRRGRFAAAACVGALALALIAYTSLNFASFGMRSGSIFETQRGELRRVPLADGSIVTLDGGTRVTIDLKSHNRNLVLERGQAFFEVAKDAHRPFIVHAGGTAITAVGTAFDVRRVGDDVTVGVAEGTVKVEQSKDALIQAGDGPPITPTAKLTAGHQMRIDSKRAGVLLAVSTDAIATWRDRRHQYISEPLLDVVADLNRYSGLQISVSDVRSGQLSVSGFVFENEVYSWLKSLETALPVIVHEESNGSITILMRDNTQPPPVTDTKE